MSFDDEKHQANDNPLKICDFCGEVARLYQGVCEQCKAIREENQKLAEKLGVC